MSSLRYQASKGLGAAHIDQKNQPVLNEFAALPANSRRRVRTTIIENLSNPKSLLFTDPELNGKAFVPSKLVRMHLPMQIANYTDSVSSLIHAQNVLLFALLMA